MNVICKHLFHEILWAMDILLGRRYKDVHATGTAKGDYERDCKRDCYIKIEYFVFISTVNIE
jgi:hypothetical protein